MQNQFPNFLTMSRIVAIPLLVGTFYIDSPYGNWIGLGILIYAGLSDFFDGFLARSWEVQSQFGKALDPIADKLLVSAVLLMLVGSDRIVGLNLLPAVVILCREILVSGLREFLAEIRVGMPVTRLAQWKTTVQILALGFLIVGPAGPDFGPVSTTMIGDVCLWIAGVFTLFTGYDYLRAGSKHLDISVEVNQISVPPPEAGTGRGKDAA